MKEEEEWEKEGDEGGKRKTKREIRFWLEREIKEERKTRMERGGT